MTDKIGGFVAGRLAGRFRSHCLPGRHGSHARVRLRVRAWHGHGEDAHADPGFSRWRW